MIAKESPAVPKNIMRQISLNGVAKKKKKKKNEKSSRIRGQVAGVQFR